jgi:metallophosphoesterase superfamily enzyme
MRVLDDWLLTVERIAVHLPSATAVVADLHLGYAEARQRAGEAVPNDIADEQLAGLGRGLRQHAVRRLVVAGDLLEDGRCHAALTSFQELLGQARVELAAIVPGNHDRGLETLSPLLPQLPLFPDGYPVGRWRVIHGDGPIPDGPVVQGHEHPCVRWARKTRAVRPRYFGSRAARDSIEGACYLAGPGRLILPAYSREAAGVNVLSARCWRSYRCYVLAGDRILDLGELARIGNRE